MSIDKEKSYNKETKRVFTSRSEPTLLYMNLLMPKKYVHENEKVQHGHGKYVFQKSADKQISSTVLLL